MEPIVSPSIAWIALAFFGTLWLSLGYMWSKTIKNKDDFMLAGRNVGFAMGTATVMATWVSANTVLTAPELGFSVGIWGLIGYSFAGLGVLFFAKLAFRIKDVMPNGVTSGDFMRFRYGEKTWGLYMLLSMAYNIAFLVTQAMGGGLLLNAVFGIPYHVGMLAITIICVIYTMLGGLKAVIGTDYIQTLMILASIVIVVPIAITKLGFGNLYGGILENVPDRIDMLKPLGLMYAFNGAVFSLGEIFHSNLWWIRAHSMRKDIARKSWTAGGIIWMAVPILAGSSGLVALSQGYDVPQLNMIFPVMAIKILGVAGALLVTMVVLAAITSTLDSLLAGTASLLAEDIYRVKMNPHADMKQMDKVNRIIIAGLGIIAVAFAWFQPGTMGQLLYFSGAFVCAMIWPIIYGLYDSKASATAAVCSMVAGALAGVYVATQVSSFGAAISSAAVSLPVFLIVSKIKPDSFDFSKLDPDQNL